MFTVEDEEGTAESKQHTGHRRVFLQGFCSKDQNCSWVLWKLQRCSQLVSDPREARMEIPMLDAVAMVVRREKTEEELQDARRVG